GVGRIAGAAAGVVTPGDGGGGAVREDVGGADQAPGPAAAVTGGARHPADAQGPGRRGGIAVQGQPGVAAGRLVVDLAAAVLVDVVHGHVEGTGVDQLVAVVAVALGDG